MSDIKSAAESRSLLRWRIGEVTVTRLPEYEVRQPAQAFLPDATPDSLARHPWLVPDFVTVDGRLRISIHALVVEGPGLRLIVDTCFGEKMLPDVEFLERQGDFLAGLASIGLSRDTVDLVLCTHLHFDHVGWNTMQEEGRWAPTFPRARYLIGRMEYDYWNTSGQSEELVDAATMLHESVTPVIEAGLVEFVETDHRLSPELRLVPTPGHTPGHVSLLIESQGEHAMITGDMLHHPCQIPNPDWAMPYDSDTKQAAATREQMLTEWETNGTLVIGTHFAGPTAGHIARENGSRRLLCGGHGDNSHKKPKRLRLPPERCYCGLPG